MAVEDIVSGYLDTENGRLRTEECERVGSNILSLRGENRKPFQQVDQNGLGLLPHISADRDFFVLHIKTDRGGFGREREREKGECKCGVGPCCLLLLHHPSHHPSGLVWSSLVQLYSYS